MALLCLPADCYTVESSSTPPTPCEAVPSLSRNIISLQTDIAIALCSSLPHSTVDKKVSLQERLLPYSAVYALAALRLAAYLLQLAFVLVRFKSVADQHRVAFVAYLASCCKLHGCDTLCYTLLHVISICYLLYMAATIDRVTGSVVSRLANCFEMDYKINSPYRRVSGSYDVQAVMMNGSVQSELVDGSSSLQQGSNKMRRSSKVADRWHRISQICQIVFLDVFV